MIQNVPDAMSASFCNDAYFVESEPRHYNMPTPEKGLTPLWEEIVKKTSLPEEFDIDTFFRIVRERLNSPEREVRQHALRVLKDFIPVVKPYILEIKINTVLVDILNNLGNSAPSLRKGCIDCLYMYVKHSDDSDSALKNVVFTGLYKESNSNLQTNTVAGIIMALPFLIVPHISQDTLYYVITALFNKLIQVTYQEVALKALLQTESILGKERFRSILNICGYDNREKDLEMLSQVYGINVEQPADLQLDYIKGPFKISDDEFESFLEKASDTLSVVEPKNGTSDNIILEAEIKLDTGTAITMQVHEENCNFSPPSENMEDSKSQIREDQDEDAGATKQDSEDYYVRSPRRVRFGGEVIKMRTPDSDGQSTDNSSKNSTRAEKPKKTEVKSLIPIRAKRNIFSNNQESLDSQMSLTTNTLVAKRSFIPIRKDKYQRNGVSKEYKDQLRSFSVYPEDDKTSGARFSTTDEANRARNRDYMYHFYNEKENSFNCVKSQTPHSRNGKQVKQRDALGRLANSGEELDSYFSKYRNRDFMDSRDNFKVSTNVSVINHERRDPLQQMNSQVFSSRSPSMNFGMISTNSKDDLQRKSMLPLHSSRRSVRGHQSATTVSLIPVAGMRTRSNHSAPEICYTSQRSTLSPESHRSWVDEFSIQAQKSRPYCENNNDDNDHLSKSPSNGSFASTTEIKENAAQYTSLPENVNDAESEVTNVTEDAIVTAEILEISQEQPNQDFSETSSVTDRSSSINTTSALQSPASIHNEIVNYNERYENVRGQNLSKSDTDLRHPRQVTRTSVSSAPSAVKVISFTPLDEPEVSSSVVVTSLPDSLNVLPEQKEEIQAEVQEKSCRRPATLKCRGLKNFCARKLQQQNFACITKQSLNVTLTQLESKDWETSVKGLKAITILVRENSVQVNGHLHPICVLIGRHIRSLRSQVARCACNASAELFTFPVKGLEAEIDDLAAALLHRTADTNRFLRNDAKNALDKMCTNLSALRVIPVILNKGMTHQNAIVRCESSRLLCLITQNIGYEKVFQLPKDLRDRVLKTGANLLSEGSSETRQHAQKMLMCLSQYKQFPKLMINTVSPSSMRIVRNVMQKHLKT